MLDVMEQALSFAVNQGLPGREICCFLSFYVSVLDQVAENTEGIQLMYRYQRGNIAYFLFMELVTSLLTVLQRFKDTIVPNYSSHLTPLSLQACTAYTTKSILQHFHLYQFLLTQPHTTDLTSVELAVETPGQEPPSLEEGVEGDLWLKMKKREDLKAEQEKKIEDLEKIGEQAVFQMDAKLEEAYKTQLADLADGPKKMSHQQISVIIDALVKAHIDSSMAALAHSLLVQSMELEFRVERLEVLLAPSHKEVLSSSMKSSGNSSKL